MSIYLEINNITLDIPIFDVSRSFRTSLINYYTGGKINQSNTNRSNNISVRAIEDVSFRLEAGDRLGLIGHNGSGKTSLLRILAGIYKPSIGSISYNGKITSLFNSAIGLEIDDSGLDNIFTIGTYLGMSKNEIEQKKDAIISFCGLGDFIYLPVRTYSSGMLLRLQFSIATSLEPQILLMDEGFGTGDTKFTETAQARLNEFYNKIDLLVMASHSNELIKTLCNKALLLEHGKVKAFGKVEEVLQIYHGNSVAIT